MTSDPITRLNTALEGRYRIERELGAGGMATVYLAEDVKHHRQVALKVLKPELAAVVGADRFLAEIKTTANLQHPNILPLFDSGESDGFLWYTMPYVEGETLRDRLERERQIPVTDAVRIASELAEALDHAHRQGVVHRDMKPANVLIRDGRPMIADFGIALAVGTAGGTRLTETGLSLGTPYYMSPEQAVGDQPVTSASDIYALGCVVYELLTGEPPHVAGSAQAVLARIITGEVKSAREHRPAVPLNVDGALRKALERLPADRFATAAEFGEALQDPGFRYGADPSEASAARRSPAWMGVAALVGVGVGLGLGAVLGSEPESGMGSSGAVERPLQMTFSGRAEFPAIAPDGDFVAYVDSDCLHGTELACVFTLMVQEVGSGRPIPLQELNDVFGEPRWDADGSSVLFAGALSDGRVGIFSIPRLGGAVTRVGPLGVFDTHPVGDSLFAIPAREDAAVAWIMSLSDRQVVDSLPLPTGEVESISWSPDAQRLVLGTQARLYLMGRDGTVLDSHPIRARPTVRWTADSEAVLFWSVGVVREDDLVRLPVGASGRFGEPQVIRAGIPTIYTGQFDVARRSGDLVLRTGDAREDIWAFDLQGPDEPPRRLTGGTTWYGGPGSFDGETVYYLRGDALGDNVYALDLESGTETPLTSETTPGGSAVRFSRDGSLLAFMRSIGPDEQGNILSFELVEVATGRIRSYPISEPFRGPIPVSGDRVLGQLGGEAAIADPTAGDFVPLATIGEAGMVRDSLSIGSLASSPDGGRALS